MSSSLVSTLATEEQKLLACIHCGLCLEACPTYTITGDENDGPRGRLYLMRAVGEGRLRNDSPSFERHIDRCLGCRACEQVCPAGVEYGQLLEAARGELFESGKTRGFSYAVLRLVLKHVWLQPRRLRFAFAMSRLFRDTGLPRVILKSGLAKVLPERVRFGLALLQSSTAKVQKQPKAPNRDALSEPSASAGGPSLSEPHAVGESAQPGSAMLFTGCVGEGLFARVNRATSRVLEANGCAVEAPRDQVCCGALHAHAGDLEGARKLARTNIAAFKSAGPGSPIITNAGGCGAMLASYGHLLSNDDACAAEAKAFSGRVRDVSQQLETVGLKTGTGETAKVTYDSSCHLLYGQHAGEAPLAMLAAITELDFARLEGSERCCGGAGIYNILEPELSREVLKEKLANVEKCGAKILATGNPGCQMQIGAGALLAGMDLMVCHPVELLDQAYARAGMYQRSER